MIMVRSGLHIERLWPRGRKGKLLHSRTRKFAEDIHDVVTTIPYLVSSHTPHIFLYRTSLPFVTYIRLVCLVVLLYLLVGGSNRGANLD